MAPHPQPMDNRTGYSLLQEISEAEGEPEGEGEGGNFMAPRPAGHVVNQVISQERAP